MADRAPLELAVDERDEMLRRSVERIVRHADGVRSTPVAPPDATQERAEWLRGYDFGAPRSPAEVVDEVAGQLSRGTVHTTHPRSFGLFNPTPTWPSIAGDVLAAGFNPQLAAWSHAPAAVDLERHVVDFMAARMRLPAGTVGHFTTGGAEANHSATILALTDRIDGFEQDGVFAASAPPVFYTSAESHLAWLKIAHACGLGRSSVRLIRVDAELRMDVAALEQAYEKDVAAGLVPFMIVGTAGTTGGAAIDPLADLARLSRGWGLHFHVDAAWAGAVSMSDDLRDVLSGIEAADTVTVDAHKWLSVPMAAGMLLIADASSPRRAFRVSTAYMPAATEHDDPYTTSLQWSRRAIGLKVFVSLAVFGRTGYAAQIERDVALGRYIAQRAADRGWTRINRGPLPVICVVDRVADALAPEESWRWHSAVVDDVVRSGVAWISPVRLNGRAAVRICVTSHRSTEHDVDLMLDAVDEARAMVRRPR